MNKRRMVCAALLGPLFAPQAAPARPVGPAILRVGYFELKPHIDITGDMPSGPAITYLRHIADRMPVKLALAGRAMPLDRLLQEIKAGHIDVVIALGRNPERDMICRFPAEPFYFMQPSLALLRTRTADKVAAFSVLEHMSIGGYSGGYLSPAMRQHAVRLELLHGQDVTARNLAKLMSGRLDAVYSPDALDLEAAIGRLGIAHAVRIVALPEPPVGLYTAFARHISASLVVDYEAARRQLAPYQHLLTGKAGAASR